MDPTPITHIDPHGAEFAVACLYCGQVHRTKTERRTIIGRVVEYHAEVQALQEERQQLRKEGY